MKPLNELPHFDTDDRSFPPEFLESLRSIKDTKNQDDDVIPGSMVYDLVKEYGVIDFAFERYEEIKDLAKYKDEVNKKLYKFYVDLDGKNFLFDYDRLTSRTLDNVERKEDGVVTLPEKWYYAFLHRLEHLPKSELKQKESLKESKIKVYFRR
jgi:hypothetical protein